MAGGATMAAMAYPHSIIADLHNTLLRMLSAEVHHNGLQMAAKQFWNKGVIDNKLYRQLSRLETAYQVSRHITEAYSRDMIERVQQAVKQNVEVPAPYTQEENSQKPLQQCQEERNDRRKRTPALRWRAAKRMKGEGPPMGKPNNAEADYLVETPLAASGSNQPDTTGSADLTLNTALAAEEQPTPADSLAELAARMDAAVARACAVLQPGPAVALRADAPAGFADLHRVVQQLRSNGSEPTDFPGPVVVTSAVPEETSTPGEQPPDSGNFEQADNPSSRDLAGGSKKKRRCKGTPLALTWPCRRCGGPAEAKNSDCRTCLGRWMDGLPVPPVS